MFSLMKTTRGAALTEYGLLTGLVAITAIAAIAALGSKIDFGYRVANEELWMAFNGGTNFLENGDFDTIEGLVPRNFGFESGSVAGWVSNNGLPFELHYSGYGGMPSAVGGYWLDMAASPGAMDISQQVQGLIAGRVYKMTLMAGDRTTNLTSRTRVYWNGIVLGDLTASVPRVMEEHVFYFQAGAGDGSDTIRLVEMAANPATANVGMSIDLVRIWGR